MEGEGEVAEVKENYEEGDYCCSCEFWWWDDGQWHELRPFAALTLQRRVFCPSCLARAEMNVEHLS